MSRLGKLPVDMPAGTKAIIASGTLNVEGPKGKLSMSIPKGIEVALEGTKLISRRGDDTPQARALHGLTRSLMANVVKGVSTGFERKLQIQGVGFRAAVKGTILNLTIGYSHPVDLELPKGVSARVDANTSIVLSSSDKAVLGDFAAKVRAVRPPEPYQGKGIRYLGEVVRKKAGKAAAK